MEQVLLPRLTGPGSFPWEFFGYLLGFGAVAIIFLFYFNRLLAYILSTLAHTYLWHYYGSSVSIEAVQLSPLAGRLFIKNLRYYGRNETISIASCYLTWKYWLRHVLDNELFNAPKNRDGTEGGISQAENTAERLSGSVDSRLQLNIRGLEWFVYNRSPAYEAVLAAVKKTGKQTIEIGSQGQEQAAKLNPTTLHPQAQNPKSSFEKPKEYGSESSPAGSSSREQDTNDAQTAQNELPGFLRLFPISIICKKASMVMGNNFTTSILVATASTASGLIDARFSGAEDLYKQCFDFVLDDFLVKFLHNEDHTGSILEAGAPSEASKASKPVASHKESKRHTGRSTLHKLKTLFPQFQKSTDSLLANHYGDVPKSPGRHNYDSQGKWRGLSRYLDDAEDDDLDHERWKSIEYAQVRTIVESPKLTMSFFWDVPGEVQQGSYEMNSEPKTPLSHINGGNAPEWGFNINVSGGTINYGPWADRQRANLQNIFFPSSYTSATPADALKPGQQRQCTQFKINITLDAAVNLRIYTREQTKDWRWKDALKKVPASDNGGRKKTKKHEKNNSESEIREAGWLYLTAAANTSVTYIMDMLASADGFGNTLELDAPSINSMTSVNHGRFLKTGRMVVNCNLSNPLGWNSLRTWMFNVAFDEVELFFLRDHAFLLVDLINDWTAGPPSNFMTFVPFLYKFKLTFNDLKVYLNVNDANIIDVPASTHDNAYLLFGADKLALDLDVPAINYRPQKNAITFSGVLDNLSLELICPTWNTMYSLLKQKRLGMVERLYVNGCYDYYTSNFPSQTDTLTMDITGEALILHVYGFLIRYFMVFRENFFGDDLHFQTLEEYQQRLAKNGIDTGTKTGHQSSSMSNDLDVILAVKVVNSSLILPSGIYSAEEHIRADVPDVSLELRFTNYYMDLEVSSSPMSLTRGIMATEEMISDTNESYTQVFLDGVWLSGHRLFGLPPTEPTYVCNWDFSVGALVGQCSLDFVSSLMAAARVIGFQFKDKENALPRNQPKTIHDVTFLRLKTAPIELWINAKETAVQVKSAGITLQFDDLAGDLFSEKLKADVRDISLSVVDAIAAARYHTNKKEGVPTHALLRTSISLHTVEIAANFSAQRRLQQNHIRKHDSRTNRTPWLLADDDHHLSISGQGLRVQQRPPVMFVPPMPGPVDTSAVSESSAASRKEFLQHQNSFISLRSERRRSPQSTTRTTSTAPATLQPRLLSQQFKRSPSRSNSQFSSKPLRLALSSPYNVPQFSFLGLIPDEQYLPSLDQQQQSNETSDNDDDDLGHVPEDDIVRTTIMLSCGRGITAFLMPAALTTINHLIMALQPATPEQVLDDIQLGALPRVSLGFNKPRAAKTTQFRVQIPQTAVRLITQSTAPDAPFEWQTYDFGVSRLIMTARTGASEGSASSSPFTGHLAFNGARAIVRGHDADSDNDEARIQANLAATTAWLNSDKRVAGQAQSNGLEITSLNRKVEYLAAIVKNAISFMESIVPPFQTTAQIGKARTQAVVEFLAKPNLDLADPPFLNSASYIGRASIEHARNSDTWKMISRLRHVANNLLRLTQQELDTICHTSKTTLSPAEVKEVMHAFNQWRGWDLDHIEDSALMQLVFDTRNSDGAPMESTNPIDFRVNLIRLGATIDPGPNQNELLLQHISFCAESSVELLHITGKTIRNTVATLFCDDTIVRLNWDILEFVEDILQYSLKHKDNKKGLAKGPIIAAPSNSNVSHSLQLVTGFETNEVVIKTINLEFVALTRSLKSATILKQSNGNIETVNTIINAEYSAITLSSRSELILVNQIQTPSVHGALTIWKAKDHSKRKWSGGAVCQKLGFEIRQDLLGLLTVADLLLRDEITYIKKLLTVVQSEEPRSNTSVRPIISASRSSTEDHIEFALLLEDYQVSIALLSSLHYILRGHTARSHAKATTNAGGSLYIDGDVMQNVHTIENRAHDQVDEVATFDLPPINGMLVITKRDQVLRAAVAVAIDKISLDASAIHALLNTISRREVSSFRKDVQRDLTLLESKAQAMFTTTPGTASTETPASSLTILYDLDIVAEGFEIVAVTSKSSKQPARLTISIGSLLVNVRNANEGNETVLSFPEASANVQLISVILERTNGRDFRNCGEILLGFSFSTGAVEDDQGRTIRSIDVSVSGPEINVFAETAPTIVDIIGYLQQRFKGFDLPGELQSLRTRRNRSKSTIQFPSQIINDGADEEYDATAALFGTTFSVDISKVQIAWRVGDMQPISPGHDVEDLVFSIEHINLATRHTNSAKLVMANLQLQMVGQNQPLTARSKNSALMPEVLFNVAYLSTSRDRRFAFQAVGKSVDLRMTPKFLFPAADLQRSIALATHDLRKVIADWNSSLINTEQNKKIITAKRISSILVDADFAGAVVHLQATGDPRSPASPYTPASMESRMNDNVSDFGRTTATLRTPGIAFKVEYTDIAKGSRALNAEIKIDASTNSLLPSIVPLILDLTNSIREVVHEKEDRGLETPMVASTGTQINEDLIANPIAILGDCKLNLGLRICRQKFGLSCQPIAKVEARAEFEDIYITINTVQPVDQDRFIAVSARIKKLQASVQHTYSQDATGQFVADYIELSLMNSRHVSDIRGISAILNFGPIKVLLNARQLHDFLMFREIWLPEELQQRPAASPPPVASDAEQGFIMQRYQQVAAASPFPWNATIAVAEINVELDLGQSLGKSSFQISKFWTASKKLSNWEQNLHVGFERIKLDCVGRLNCYVGLENMALRTSIKWQETNEASQQIPLVQASIGFENLKVKAAFEYQAFLVGNFSSLKFLMYNIREGTKTRDRLVCTVDGEKVQAYCTTHSSATALALHQTIQRLIVEKKQSFDNAMRDVRRYYKRAGVNNSAPAKPRRAGTGLSLLKDDTDKVPLQLQTNVVISLKLLNVGVYPRSFADSTIFKLDGSDAQAKFSVLLRDNTIQSSLGLGLGQVRIALSNINRSLEVPNFEEMSIDSIVQYSTGSRGGTILKVPRVIAGMQTWQIIRSTMVEYIFRSSFEGKVEVGWNINRINAIRTMWNTHSTALAARLGKALPQPAVQITGVPIEDTVDKEKNDKITAVVTVPLSKYSYTAREPPVIETPQLRDMGEATPPLEWIGLQRDRLPNLTHQIIIVPLLEIAKEVEDAYGKILGVS